MAINGCSSGLVVTAVVALLLLPIQYYVPDFHSILEDPIAKSDLPKSEYRPTWLDFLHLPPVDLFMTVSLLLLGLITYVFEWIQRKLMERRIVKLNYYLSTSLERLQTLDAQEEQQEATLKMVQNATSEYNLLLYMLLRQHRCLAAKHAAPSSCYLDKGLDDDLNFLRNQTLDE